jgi:hypothetical protein
MIMPFRVHVLAIVIAQQAASPLSGEYVCAYGCRLTDANPALRIEGGVALCTNEFGGLFTGRLLGDGSIACFNKTGVFAPDGVTLNWSDGVIWKRRGPVRN